VVSSQGNNSYALFRREGDNAYVGSFAVIADGASGIDGISETDGLDVTSASLGAGLERSWPRMGTSAFGAGLEGGAFDRPGRPQRLAAREPELQAGPLWSAISEFLAAILGTSS
jgi:hypothetical protein